MEGWTHNPNSGYPQDPDLPRQSQYPDPEEVGLSNSTWPPPSSIEASFQPHGHETYTLQNAQAEFESASALRRSQSREESDESDFLEELNDDE